MRGMDVVQFLRLRTWLGSAAPKLRLRGVLEGSGTTMHRVGSQSVCSFSLHSTCTHCQRAGEALACVTCTLSSHLQDRFSLFSFGQGHPSLLGMKIIFQTHWVFPSFIAEYCLLQEWRIMKARPRKVIFFERNNLTPVSFLHEYLFASHICCWVKPGKLERRRPGVISGVLEIAGNTALLQGS